MIKVVLCGLRGDHSAEWVLPPNWKLRKGGRRTEGSLLPYSLFYETPWLAWEDLDIRRLEQQFSQTQQDFQGQCEYLYTLRALKGESCSVQYPVSFLGQCQQSNTQFLVLGHFTKQPGGAGIFKSWELLKVGTLQKLHLGDT